MRPKILICVFLACCHLASFGQIKVTFLINRVAPVKETDTHLFIAGDFNNWDPRHAAFELRKQNDGTWQLSKSLPKGIYNFKITRGSWQKIECAVDGKSIDNRCFKLSGDTTIMIDIAGWQDNFKPEEKKHTASANVHMITENFDMPQLGRQRRIWIYLPADYESSSKKYPVIYMHDGQNLFDAYTSGYGEWGADEIMDKLPAKEQCIIVGIDHGGEHRMTEYNPYNSKFGKAEGDKYVDFLVKTLKPYIDQHYHTQTDAKHTTIAGSSMGGLISFYAVLKYPEVFGNGGIFSPSFWIAPDIFNYAQQHLNTKSRFYFVCGDSEADGIMVEPMEKMVKLVRAKGISEQNSPETIVKGAKHNEKQWNSDFPEFYNWLISSSR
ncbi:MAG TPA: alpha/beta hydrolase-fold protein [Mucilaginibacter sp.]